MMAMQEAERKQNEKLKELVDAMDISADHMFDAMNYGAMAKPESTQEQLRGMIKRKIEYHERMKKTLEWFGAHIGLDKPDEDLLVSEVIMAGLEALAQRYRKGLPNV